MPNFVSFVASIAELAHGENCILTHSLTQSLTQLDAPGTEAFASEQVVEWQLADVLSMSCRLVRVGSTIWNAVHIQAGECKGNIYHILSIIQKQSAWLVL